jgi:hypothetical protein
LREQHSSEDKARFDLQYLLNLSLWTDLSLLVQTIWTLAMRSLIWRRSPADMELMEKASDPIEPPVCREILENAYRP